MHRQDHWHLGTRVYENTLNQCNGKSVRSHNGQGMQWDILSDGVEVPETRSKQNSDGWTHWTAELYLQFSWLFISSHKHHQEEGSKSPGISMLWQNQASCLSSLVHWLLCPCRCCRMEEPYNKLFRSMIISIFLGEMKIPSTKACEGPYSTNCSGKWFFQCNPG